MPSRLFIVWVALLFAAMANAAVAAQEELKVGVFEKPPYAHKDAAGEWTGLAIELWKGLASDLRISFNFVELQSSNAIDAVASGEVDILVGEVATSAEREKVVDFSQPYLSQPLAAAFEESVLFPHWLEFFKSLPAHGLTSVVGVMLGALILFAFLFWLAERGHKEAHFGGKPLHGLGLAMWFSAVTMTTVGYGDKTPMTFLGRLLTFVWMFCGILMVSALTATVASTVAIARLTTTVETVSDLTHYRVGVQAGSLADSVLHNAGMVPERFGTPEEGMRALPGRQIGAFVADRATIRAIVNHEKLKRIEVVTLQTTWSHLAFAVPQGKRRVDLEAINVALLEITIRPQWLATMQQWLGPALTD